MILSPLTSMLSVSRTLSPQYTVCCKFHQQRQEKAGSLQPKKDGEYVTQYNISSLGYVLKDLIYQVDFLKQKLFNKNRHSKIAEHWRVSHISAQSFFENKTGNLSTHPKKETFFYASVKRSIGCPLFRDVLKSLAKSHYMIQRRGFITKRQRSRGGHIDHDNHYSFDDHYKYEGETERNRAFLQGLRAAQVQSAKNDPWQKFFRFLLYGICLVLIIKGLSLIFNFKISFDGDSDSSDSSDNEIKTEDVNVTLDDVRGLEEAKQELQEVVSFLKNPTKFTSIGAKLPKGVLLVGPPGVGKTLLARAVAGEANVPFFHAAGSEFDEMFVGVGAKRLRQLFSTAKERAPCIIFIDEFDSVGSKRTSSAMHPHANQTINQLLSEMDGFKQNEGIIVLGATNKVDLLDKALRRPGRFDVEVTISLPDLKGRKDIIELYINKVRKDADVDVDKLARGTTGFSGAQLENLINQAALKAAIDSQETVAMKHLEFARDKIIMGTEWKHKIPDENTNWITAYHESGHTLVAFFTKDAVPLHKVTIIPRGQSLGHTSFLADKEVYNTTVSQLKASIDTAMGGRVAEELIYGEDNITTGASSDLKNATKAATAMVMAYGMSEKVGLRSFSDQDISPAHREIIDQEIKRLLKDAYDRAKNILKTHEKELHRLAEALMKYETLDKEEIRAVVVDGRLNIRQ